MVYMALEAIQVGASSFHYTALGRRSSHNAIISLPLVFIRSCFVLLELDVLVQ